MSTSIDQAASPSSIACDTGISLLHLANKLLDAQSKISDSPTHNTVKDLLNKNDSTPIDNHLRQETASFGDDLPKVKRKLWETTSSSKKRKTPITCVALDDNQNTVHVYCDGTADSDSISTDNQFKLENAKESSYLSESKKLFSKTPGKDISGSPFQTKSNAFIDTFSPAGRKIAKKYQCDQCKYETDNRSHLRRHQNCKHINFKPYYCYVCYEEFARSEKVRSHFLKDHPDVEYDGFKVRKTYGPDTYSTFQATNNKVKDNIPMQCPDKTLNNVVTKPGSPVFNGNKNNMILTPQSQKRHHCPDCPYSGKDSWHLKRHISEVHKGDKEFKCPKCEYATSRKHRIISHMKGHGQLACFYCEYQTSEAEAFQDHLRECSRSNKPKSYICEHCNQSLSSMSDFFIHVERNHNIPLYRCSCCAFATTDQKNLNKHELIHLTPMPNANLGTAQECSLCSSVFSSLASLNDHLETSHKVNNNNKPLDLALNCDTMQKVCEQMPSVALPVDQPVKDSVSEMTSEACLPNHDDDLIGAGPAHAAVEIICSICGDDFHSNEDLNNHIETEHNDE